jgi:hypothetical protein
LDHPDHQGHLMCKAFEAVEADLAEVVVVEVDNSG